MKRITIAFDSFKGSLSSHDAGLAFAEGWRSQMPDAEFQHFVVADGGEGTTEALVEAMAGEYRSVKVHDPLGRVIAVSYGVVDDGATAIVDVATASGLTLLTAEERNPMVASSYGTGELIAMAIAGGARRIYVGLGGSATNDGGMGMLRALGYRFYDSDDAELLGMGADLLRVERIDDSDVHTMLSATEIIVAADVDNPLYGRRGAAHIYAPQKGADAAMVEALDCGLCRFAEVVARHTGYDMAEASGAGAAGGLGFAFMALLGARIERGVERVLDIQHFDRRVVGSELVVTGEGCIDAQTLMGKAPWGVLQRAKRYAIPAIAVGGLVMMCEELQSSDFEAIYCAKPEDMPLSEAMLPERAKENMRRIAAHIARNYISK